MLLPQHIADLRGSGLTDATIAESGCYSEADPRRLASLLGWDRPATNLGAGLVFRFIDLATSEFGDFVRVKPDNPRPTAGKYETAKGALRAYFVRSSIPAIVAGEPLGLVEGEKKALAAVQAGLPAIGLSGVWNWQKKRETDVAGKKTGERELIPDLDAIDWRRRRVWIGFDFDTRRNPNVNHAAAELARVLHDRGANVTITVLPAGPRDGRGVPGKMAIDDYLVAFGAETLRRFIADQMAPATTRAIADYRSDLEAARVDSLLKRGIYFDSSPTGAGKTHADVAAIKRANRSLTILPTHKNCGEVEADYQARGLDATAFPKIDGDTCGNLEAATKSINSGLSASQSVCPTCPYKAGCEYRASLDQAEHAAHRIATHHRAGLSFETLGKGAEYIAIHEDAAAVLRPSFAITGGLAAVGRVVDEAINIVRQNRRWRPGEHFGMDEIFLHKMLTICEQLAKQIEAGEVTAVLEPPLPAAVPAGIDARLFEAMQSTNVWPTAEPMQLVKLLAAGDILELVLRVDEIHGEGGKKQIARSVQGVRRVELPEESSIWIADATAEIDDVELMIGRPVIDATPKGQIERRHPLVQWPRDVTKRTSKATVLGILQRALSRLPFQRVGVITHREFKTAIDGTAKTGEVLGNEFRHRIARVEHFRGGASRGSNEWLSSCDAVLILGTPRVPPAVVKTRLVVLGLAAAAARPATWTEWGRDYWSGITIEGRRTTIKTRSYRDHDWNRACRAIVRAELVQAAGRGRATNLHGIPVVVITTEDLGLPLIDFGDEFADAEDLLAAEAVRNAHFSYNYILGKVSVNSRCAPVAKVSVSNSWSNLTRVAAADSCELEGNDMGSSVSTATIAEAMGKSQQQTRRILAKLERLGYVNRVGERKGWLPSTPAPLDLYAIAMLSDPAPKSDQIERPATMRNSRKTAAPPAEQPA